MIITLKELSSEIRDKERKLADLRYTINSNKKSGEMLAEDLKTFLPPEDTENCIREYISQAMKLAKLHKIRVAENNNAKISVKLSVGEEIEMSVMDMLIKLKEIDNILMITDNYQGVEPVASRYDSNSGKYLYQTFLFSLSEMTELYKDMLSDRKTVQNKIDIINARYVVDVPDDLLD